MRWKEPTNVYCQGGRREIFQGQKGSWSLDTIAMFHGVIALQADSHQGFSASAVSLRPHDFPRRELGRHGPFCRVVDNDRMSCLLLDVLDTTMFVLLKTLQEFQIIVKCKALNRHFTCCSKISEYLKSK